MTQDSLENLNPAAVHARLHLVHCLAELEATCDLVNDRLGELNDARQTNLERIVDYSRFQARLDDKFRDLEEMQRKIILMRYDSVGFNPDGLPQNGSIGLGVPNGHLKPGSLRMGSGSSESYIGRPASVGAAMGRTLRREMQVSATSRSQASQPSQTSAEALHREQQLKRSMSLVSRLSRRISMGRRSSKKDKDKLNEKIKEKEKENPKTSITVLAPIEPGSDSPTVSLPEERNEYKMAGSRPPSHRYSLVSDWSEYGGVAVVDLDKAFQEHRAAREKAREQRLQLERDRATHAGPGKVGSWSGGDADGGDSEFLQPQPVRTASWTSYNMPWSTRPHLGIIPGMPRLASPASVSGDSVASPSLSSLSVEWQPERQVTAIQNQIAKLEEARRAGHEALNAEFKGFQSEFDLRREVDVERLKNAEKGLGIALRSQAVARENVAIAEATVSQLRRRDIDTRRRSWGSNRSAISWAR